MLERTLMLCRHVYNAAIGERREAWRMRGISVTYYQQKAELPGIKEAMPEYGEVHSQVLQDVVLRVDRAFQAFFRRVQGGRDTRLSPLSRARPLQQFHLSAIGRAMAVRDWIMASWCSRRLGAWRYAGLAHWKAHPRPSPSRVKRMAGMCASPVRTCRAQPLAPTGQETGIDVGLESFATLADGTMIHNPRCYRRAERRLKTAQRQVSRRKKGSNRRREGGASCWPKRTRR